MADLPDYTKRYVLDQTKPELTLGQFDARKIKGSDLLTPTIAGGLPTSVENPALAYDATNDEFYVRSRSTNRPIYVDLRTIYGTTLTARDWSGDFAKLQSIPTSPATETGYLKTLSDNFATRIPTDPAKESGKLTSLETLLTAIKATDGIKKIVDSVAVTNTGLSYIPSDPAKESGKLTDIAAIAYLLRATTPTIYNETMTNANAEYSQALPANTKKFLVATRDRTAFRLAFVTGKVATPTAPYMDVVANETYFEDMVSLAAQTVYFASASTGKIIEIIAWT